MFTGLVEEVGQLKKLSQGSITVGAQKILAGISLGDSVAVNGVCLTVTDYTEATFTADVMPETLRRTSITGLLCGSPVNLERALTLSSRLGGHLVSGHIDGVGSVADIRAEQNAILLKVKAEANLLRYIAPKGSVALDGISLTVVSVGEDFFTVSLIPHTREVTNLHTKKVGSLLNIETDIIAKYVERLLTGGEMTATQTTSLTPEFLAEHGFL
ncbi:MAG: riboflavin synthase [Selenomonadaceae bacterium]|nr:riboflavin synthase [Selenomonadaceae bacterium]